MQTIDSLIQKSCLDNPNKVALREKSAGHWVETSYADLWQQVAQVAGGLRNHDFLPGDHAAILAPPSLLWVVSYLGILNAGGVAIPIDKELKATELKHILFDCEARLIFTTRSFLDALLEIAEDLPHLERIVLFEQRQKLPRMQDETSLAIRALIDAWQQLRSAAQLPERDCIKLEELARQAYRLLVPNDPLAPRESAAFDLFAALQGAPPQNAQLPTVMGFAELCCADELPGHGRSPEDPAVILYTSGTTGRSKGAMLSHNNIVSNIHGACRLFKLDQRMHTLSFLPINHVFEQVCGILLPLSLGGTVSFAESLKKLGENLAEVQPTFFLGVPAVYRIFYDRIMKNVQSSPVSRTLYALPLTRPLVAAKVKKLLGESTIFISGGAALDPEIARGFKTFGIKLLQGYGITETAPVISAEPPEAPRIGSVGFPLEGVRVRIANPDPEGSGEILVSGPNVMIGYYNNPDATAEVLVDGWYHTGDLGRIDQDGYLSICGRAKNLIVTPNGKNVYPEEVEIELLKSPLIAEAMVYGHKISATAEEVHAIIFPDFEAAEQLERESGQASLTDERLEQLIRNEVLEVGKRLADYKRVKKFTLRNDEFPKTTTRKIKRYAVEALIPAS